ncbi:MAG: 3-phosphoshikimate 1-carboxyvinyltransferase [Armatimonas sp.]
MAGYLVRPVARPIEGIATVPGSKSITNRALVLAALSNGPVTLTGALFSDDTARMRDCLTALGFTVEADETAPTITVHGQGGRIPATQAELFVGNSGTTARFIAPMVALGHGSYTVDGVPRMRQRPIGDLVDALRGLGVSVDCPTGCPPLTIHSSGLSGGSTAIRADASSQFLSGLLLAAPHALAPVEVTIDGPFLSAPYVHITVEMVRHFGGTIEVSEDGLKYRVVPGTSIPPKADTIYPIEPDASSASYFFAAAAIINGKVRIPGLGKNSLQGDAAFVDILAQMGCTVTKTDEYIEVVGTDTLHGITVDMNAISDTVMTLAAVAIFADSPTVIENVAHIRHKETDRISATVCELTRLGVKVEEREDGLTIWPAERITPAIVHTYDDHRMAMAFSLIGLKHPGVTIADPECVNKTFPDYFERLEALCG